MIFPKLIVHNGNGRLHAYRGQNQIAWRFGGRILVCEVKRVIGPFYRRKSHDFFECIDRFGKPPGVSNYSIRNIANNIMSFTRDALSNYSLASRFDMAVIDAVLKQKSWTADAIWDLLRPYIAELGAVDYSEELAERLCEDVLPKVWDHVVWAEQSNKDLFGDIEKIHEFQHEKGKERVTGRWWGRNVVDWLIDYAGRLEGDLDERTHQYHLAHAKILSREVIIEQLQKEFHCNEDELPCDITDELFAASYVDGVRLYPWPAVAKALKKELDAAKEVDDERDTTERTG